MESSQTPEVPGYQVMEYLGSGARSTIWQVRDRQTGQLHALKRVVKREAGDARFLEQAINEYEVGSKVRHPVIRRIFLMKRVRRLFALREILLVMELCEGKTIQENRPASIYKAVKIFVRVGQALEAMNNAGFVHADMKPNNVLVSREGKIKIIDFGQSCPLGTVKERIQGTPDYIAPEQVHRRPLDARTDVFNFGASLYWTLTGQPIPTVLPKKDSLTMVSALKIKAPNELNPNIPPGLSKLVNDCIELEMNRRPATMKEVVGRLTLIGYKLRHDAARRKQMEEG